MIEQLLNGISTVGFPIVAYLLMYRMANQTIKGNTETLQQVQQELQRLDP